MGYQILEWDTVFFGMPVAKIINPNICDLDLECLLSELKNNGVQLVYCSSNRVLNENTLLKFNGILADEKKIFVINLEGLNDLSIGLPIVTEQYDRSMPLNDLEELAIQSAEYSRFAVDKNIPKNKFEDLYRSWINGSLSKELAEEVLVIRNLNRIIGMVTLCKKGPRGDIGLIAVEKNFRGFRYGETLVRAAQSWFIRKNYKIGQVVTQGVNIPACNLYEKCGYQLEEVNYFYHFWLKDALL